MKKKIVVGMTGSDCSILGVRTLEALKDLGVETHLVMTDTAKKVIEEETDYKSSDVETLASHVYKIDDFFAPIASGSFKTDGMVIVPCSMKTLAGVASGYSSDLLLRAADVMLKERRRLVLVTRETPLSLVHIRNMETATLAGAVVMPPVLTLYSKPESIEEMISHTVGKILDQFGIDSAYRRWGQK